MNIILNNYLGKIVFVFIDDIFIYLENKQEHEEHLRMILQVLQEQQPFSKFRNYDFFTERIHYLWNVVSKDGISFDPEKIKAINE